MRPAPTSAGRGGAGAGNLAFSSQNACSKCRFSKEACGEYKEPSAKPHFTHKLIIFAFISSTARENDRLLMNSFLIATWTCWLLPNDMMTPTSLDKNIFMG